MCWRSWPVVSLVLLLATQLTATDIFVNNQSGDDHSNGRAAQFGPVGGPVRTIARGLQLVEQGGRIRLANTGNPYRESVSLGGPNHRGFANRPLVLDGGGAILDGTVVAGDGAWHHYRGNVFAFTPRRLTYQRLFHKGQPLKQVQTARGAANVPRLEPLEWALVGDKIYFCAQQDLLPEEYQLRHAGLPVGISIYNTAYIRVQNLTIQGFHSDGVRLPDDVQNCELLKLECRANGRCGISVGGTCRVDVVGVTCYDNGRAEMIVEQFARVKIRDSDFAGGMVPPIKIEGGNVTVDGVDYQP
jgi:hypothetical protein